ncbi:MAG: maleylpyruvate isomerase N-terminal domain-containing protein [Acidimicrobiia bacterium]
MASIDELAAVDRACAFVQESITGITDDQARGPSRLPGWTRGHVLTHHARSADGMRGCSEAAARGEPAAQYPHGLDGRARDIEAGAGRPAAVLVEDAVASQAALVAVWAALPDGAWKVTVEVPAGQRTIAELVPVRRRELLVHLVDLDVGVEPAGLPRDYLDADVAWLAEFRPEW